MYLRVCVHFFKRKQNEVSHPHSLLLYSISQNYRRGTLHSLCSLTSQNTLCPGAPITPPPQKGSWVRRKRRTNKTEEEEKDQAEAGGQAVAKVDTNSGRVDQGNSTTWCLPTFAYKNFIKSEKSCTTHANEHPNCNGKWMGCSHKLNAQRLAAEETLWT